MGLVKAMSKSLIRSKLEALKNGISSEEEEEDDDYYDEEEQDNFDEEAMNDFVVEDQDVGYKASAHQKVSQSKNKSNRRNKPRQKASYSIGRKRIKTNNKNQSTMKSFFKKAPTNISKPRLSSNRNRKVHHQKRNKQKTKQKKKKTMILWIILWQIWIRTMMMMIL